MELFPLSHFSLAASTRGHYQEMQRSQFTPRGCVLFDPRTLTVDLTYSTVKVPLSLPLPLSLCLSLSSLRALSSHFVCGTLLQRVGFEGSSSLVSVPNLLCVCLPVVYEGGQRAIQRVFPLWYVDVFLLVQYLLPTRNTQLTNRHIPERKYLNPFAHPLSLVCLNMYAG